MKKLDDDIINLKGIGDKTAVLFNKAGIYSYEDLINYFPRDYVRYDDVVSVGEDTLNKTIAFEACVVKQPLMRRAGRLSVVSCQLKVRDDVINSVWFNMPYLTKSLKPGGKKIFYGQVYKKANRLCIDQPYIFTPEQFEEIKNTLQPVYPLTKGLTNQAVKKSVKNLLSKVCENEEDMIYRAMHFPKDVDELRSAREKFVYEEFFMYILRLRYMKDENMRAKNHFNIIRTAETERIIERLPYKLTKAQMKVYEEIAEDLTKDVSMNRLVQGDVGCGKTIIAFLAAIMVAANRHQAIIMAPTEILASQHFEAINKLIKDNGLNINTALLTGSMTASAKRKIYESISSGETDIIIGTHALFQEKVIYRDPALVITDEQHRFGVKQRDALASKNENENVHVLVMSATPIPRTLAIIIYGDLDISVIDEVPAKRLKVKNCAVNDSSHEAVYKFMKKETDAGHQVYVICPLVEESEGLDAKDVINYTEVLKGWFKDSVGIGCLHGRMKPQDKQKVMDAFYNNDIQILVSTTVVEVGVNVPNATVMVIENAERFGLSQLHQLRGRIGRGDAQSYCVFINGNDGEENRKRLKILTESNDGFYIAKKDLELRGPGDIFGVRQSGEMKFRVADIFTDAAVLKRASEDVDKLLEEDRELLLPKNKELKQRLEKLLSSKGMAGL